jgi:hypothetical protein
VSEAKPFDEPDQKDVERVDRQIDGEPPEADPRVAVVDREQPKIRAMRRDDDHQDDDQEPPYQRGPDQPIGGLFENGQARRHAEQRGPVEGPENAQRGARYEEPDDRSAQTRRQLLGGHASLAAIEQLAKAPPDQRGSHETRERDHPQPKRETGCASVRLYLFDPDLRRPTENRQRLNRLLAAIPNLCGDVRGGECRLGSDVGRVGGWRHRVGALGGKLGEQPPDRIGRHRRRQLQHNRRAARLGRPDGRHAEQKQYHDGERPGQHRRKSSRNFELTKPPGTGSHGFRLTRRKIEGHRRNMSRSEPAMTRSKNRGRVSS